MEPKLFVMTLILIAMLLAVQSAMAFTVSPALIERQFMPGEQQFTFTLRNPEPSPSTITIFYEGDLAPLAYGPHSITLPPGGSESAVITLSLPQELMPPGPHEMLVIFHEERTVGGTVTAAAELAPKIRIQVLYEGAYLDNVWAVQDGRQPLLVTIALENLGKAETTVTPTSTLFLVGSEEGYETTGTPTLLAGGASERVSLSIPETEATPGAYELTLFLASSREPELNNKEETRTVWLGTPSFTIKEATISRFVAGEIGRITLEAESDWNEELITHVGASIIDEQNRSWPLTSQEVAFLPGGKESFSFIWESVGAEPGPHSIELTFSTPRSSGTVSAAFDLSETLGVAGLMTPAGAQIPIILVLLLLVFGLSAYLLWRKKRGL